MTKQTVEKSRTAIAAQIQTLRDELTAPDMIENHYAIHTRRALRSKIATLTDQVITRGKRAGFGFNSATAAPVSLAENLASEHGYELSAFLAINAAMSTPELDEAEAQIAAIEAQIADLEAQDLDVREKAESIRRDVAAKLAEAEAKALSAPALVALKKQLSAME